ncbi:hypothetical protein IFM89_005020 [Coptis chinensis]|uniref:Uncharacterized protein n=1 Tax=Coptis chinensis TaxID=261450 RepID=A0A835HIC8_9MAGN|nr:hypothetical protein IFM89_005020 [Coptis chinensis]
MGAQKNNRKAFSRENSTTLQYLFDLDSKSNNSNGNYIDGNNPSNLQSSFEAENEELLSSIAYCNFIFTFNDPYEAPSQQDYKRIKLAELLSLVRASKTPLDDRIMAPLISMLSNNLFRPLPPPSYATALGDFPDDEDPMTSPVPSWPHLQFVYDILLRLVLNSESKILRSYIDQPFLLNLLYLFQSEDPRERDRLKNVSERALYVWNNEHFVKMTSQAMQEIFPVVVEGLEKNLNWHWSKSVRQLTLSVKVMLEEMEPTLYSRCHRGLELQEYLADQEQNRRIQTWERIEMAAAQNQLI